jgi:glycosyltransferase involved in cell wall biosynthesis
MIVKDESHIILECLQSIYKYVDYWVICDTGSSDNTPEIITTFFKEKEIPGELLHHKWKNFGHNRTLALQSCRGKGDYIWMIDADDMVVGDFQFPDAMSHDSYLLRFGTGFSWWRKQIFKAELDWKYVGVLHEYPYSPQARTESQIPGEYHINARTQGGRSLGISEREKYLRDAQILEQGLIEEPENERYVFYLAQSYRDAGESQKAVEWYQKRFDMGKWAEEAYYALYQKSVIQKSLNDPSWLKTALKAYWYRPTRLESLYEVIKEFRESGDFRMGYELGKLALSQIEKITTDVLFVHRDIHIWKFWDEFSLCAYYVGDKKLFKECLETILERTPPEGKHRILQNLSFV